MTNNHLKDFLSGNKVMDTHVHHFADCTIKLNQLSDNIVNIKSEEQQLSLKQQEYLQEYLDIIDKELSNISADEAELLNTRSSTIDILMNIKHTRPWHIISRVKFAIFIKSIDKDLLKFDAKKRALITQRQTKYIQLTQLIESTKNDTLDTTKLHTLYEQLNNLVGAYFAYSKELSTIHAGSLEILQNIHLKYISIPVIQLIENTRGLLAHILQKHHNIPSTNKHDEIYKYAEQFGYINNATDFDIFEKYRNCLAHPTKWNPPMSSANDLLKYLAINSSIEIKMIDAYTRCITNIAEKFGIPVKLDMLCPDIKTNDNLTKLMAPIDRIKTLALQMNDNNGKKYLDDLIKTLPQIDGQEIRFWTQIRRDIAHGRKITDQEKIPNQDDFDKLQETLNEIHAYLITRSM